MSVRMSACLAAAAVVALAGCAAGPPLRLYTLSEPSVSPIEPLLESGAPVIELERVSLPSYIDTQDILTREGDVVVRSMTGRWVNRLSLLASDFLTDRLALAISRAVVTDRRQPATPDYRITVAISDLDITRAGTATLSADWEIVSREAGKCVVRKRIRFTLDGSAATDQDVVRIERMLFDRLADSIASSLSVFRTNSSCLQPRRVVDELFAISTRRSAAVGSGMPKAWYRTASQRTPLANETAPSS
jgi:uncharacterized lipoprotein YmbA